MVANIKSKVMSGLIWSLVRAWGGRLAGFIIYFQLVRMLAPSEVGAFAAAYAIFLFLEIFIDQGLIHALIQRPTLTPGLVNATFLVNLASAIVLVAAIWVTAPALEAWLKIPALSQIVRVGSFAIIINALCLCQDALYRREFLFRRLAIRILLATIIGGAIGISMAYVGYGVWSLVGQYLGAATVSLITLWYKPIWQPSRDLDFRGLGRLSQYGVNIVGVRLLDFGSSRFIEFWIAAMLSASALGFFSVGSKISYIVLQLLGTSILDVALAGFSRLAAEPARLRNAYYKSVRLTAMVAFPCWVMLAMAPTEITVIAFGEKWLPSAPLLVPMAVLGLIQTSQLFDSALVNSIGRPSLSVIFLACRTGVVLMSLFITSNDTLQIVVIGYVAAQLVISPLNLILLRRFCGISPQLFLTNLLPAFLAAAVMGLAIMVLQDTVVVAAWSPFASLIAKSAVGVCAYCAVLLAIDRRQPIDLFHDLRNLRRQSASVQ